MLHDLSHDKPGGGGADAASEEQFARQEAIRQIERRRRFWFRATAGTIAACARTMGHYYPAFPAAP